MEGQPPGLQSRMTLISGQVIAVHLPFICPYSRFNGITATGVTCVGGFKLHEGTHVES